MSFAGLQWERPWALLFLLLIPLVIWVGTRRRPALLFPRLPALVAAGGGPLARVAWLPLGARVVAIALCALALARPVTASESGPPLSVEGIDIVVALDLSGSMQAVDFQPSDRLTVAKEVLDGFVRQRPTDRIGLVVFAGEAYTQCPLTLDHRVVRQILSQVRVGAIPDGTAIGDAIATSINRLRGGDSESQAVILLTDGDSNAGSVSPMEAAKMAADMGVRVFPILVGKECERGETCLVPFPAGADLFGKTVYRNVHIPTDPKLLESIASTTGGKAYRATDRASLEGGLQDVLEELEKTRLEEPTQQVHLDDRFHWFLLPGILAALLDVALASTLLRRFP